MRYKNGLDLGLGDLVRLVLIAPLDALGEHLEGRVLVPFTRLEVPHKAKRILNVHETDYKRIGRRERRWRTGGETIVHKPWSTTGRRPRG